MSKEQPEARKPIIRIKNIGQISAESIVTARVSVEQYDEYTGDDEPKYFQVKMTAPPTDIYLFLMPFYDDPKAQILVEILDVYQPLMTKHEDNLEFLDALTELTLLDDNDSEEGDPPDELGKP